MSIYLPTKKKKTIADATAWKANEGGQEVFVNSLVREVLAEGDRGGGKSDGLLMTYARWCEQGFGASWSGVLFRQSFPDLNDIIKRSKKWFPLIFGNRCQYNEQKYRWLWETGEELIFRHIDNAERDYKAYHGHEYPWIGWEELTNWPDDSCYRIMFSCNRCSTPGVPIMVRSTTNPYGAGRNWVKRRFRLPAYRGKLIKDATDEDGNPEPVRMPIFVTYRENVPLLTADPNYMEMSVLPSATNSAQRRAWALGDWETAAGGMFDEAWLQARRYAIIPEFDLGLIPRSWRIRRGFDWGSSHPFSVGWYAISDGTTLTLPGREPKMTVRGDIFRVQEWYGSSGGNKGIRYLAQDITKGIIERELKWGIHDRVSGGVADAQIFATENGNSIAKDMQKSVEIFGVRYKHGISWSPSVKKPGSRIDGWQKFNARILATIPNENGQRENPGLFVSDVCHHFLQTVPYLTRDPKDPDDVNTKEEDHIADETRYVIYDEGNRITVIPIRGR